MIHYLNRATASLSYRDIYVVGSSERRMYTPLEYFLC